MSEPSKFDLSHLLRCEASLVTFGELALTCEDLTQILTEACRLVRDALGTDLAKVMQLQGDGKTLLVRAGVGWKPGVIGAVTLRADDDTSEGHALKTGEPMISPDIERETRFAYPAFLTDNGVKAIANVIIIGGNGQPPFGILQVDSRTPRAFSDSDVSFLCSYANLLAAAVDRLRVFGTVRSSEARLRLALEAGKLGSWDFDVAGDTATRSPRHDQIFGYPDALPAWNAKTLLDHVLPEDRVHVAGEFRLAIETGTELHIECRIRRADDGETRWIEVDGRSYGGAGSSSPIRLLGIVADITDRKRAEEALLRSNEILEARVSQRTIELTDVNAKLSEANAKLTLANARLEAEADDRERIEEALRQAQKMEAVGQLTGGLAHDFNNLLQGISGSLELVRMRVLQGRTDDLGRYIESAMGSAHRAATLTHRLLAFSRRQTLDPKPVDVNVLAGGIEELLRRTVGPSIEVETSFAAEPWPTLCDPHQLESALLNLVINARDAMPDGGQLLIETANALLRDRRGTPREQPPQDVPPGDYVSLSVVDTGAGMSAAVMVRAFDPFFTTKPIGQGTGLGLSMIHGFVQQSGGHVRLRSEIGQGTTVTIYLPRYRGAMDAEAVDTATTCLPAAVGSGVVLVVEDQPDVRLVVRDVLSELGYAVLEADSGRAGLVIADSSVRIDLLLTDVGLPGGMNGRQLADAARQRRPDLKVLFITGYADAMAVGNGQLDDGMQVMVKPFALEALAARVHDIICG